MFFKKKNNDNNADNPNLILNDSEITSEDIKRIAEGAGHIINMLINVFATEKGVNIRKSLLYAAGLAGYACHNTVKVTAPEQFVLVETKSGKKYYYGDGVNRFFAENKYSVLSFAAGSYQYFNKANEVPDANKLISQVALNIGNESYRICNEYEPGEVYSEIKNCYNGIYENMTAKYCKNIKEEPVLFGIVLQNVMINAMKIIPVDEVFNNAVEIACCISKMDDDSV